ncbi:MAG TPA: hypothetical protein VF795_07730 [Desulfuromonadaceae bacterium]
MFYLFICTAILINTFMDLGVQEAALLWMALLCGYLVTSYLRIVKNSERVQMKLRHEYRSRIDEIQNELLSAKPAKGASVAARLDQKATALLEKKAAALIDKAKASAH